MWQDVCVCVHMQPRSTKMIACRAQPTTTKIIACRAQPTSWLLGGRMCVCVSAHAASQPRSSPAAHNQHHGFLVAGCVCVCVCTRNQDHGLLVAGRVCVCAHAPNRAAQLYTHLCMDSPYDTKNKGRQIKTDKHLHRNHSCARYHLAMK